MTEITISMNNRGTYYLCAVYPVGFNRTFDGTGKTQHEAYADAIKIFERNGFKMSECTVVQDNIHRELPSVEFLYVVCDDYYGDIITGFSDRDEAITAMKNGVKVEVMYVSRPVPTFTYSNYSMDSLCGKYVNPECLTIKIEDDDLPF